MYRVGQNYTLENQIIANETIDKKLRYKQILEILADGKEMTAREVAYELWQRHYIPAPERNCSAPRLTELRDQNIVEACGEKIDQWTNKSVTLYRIREKEAKNWQQEELNFLEDSNQHYL